MTAYKVRAFSCIVSAAILTGTMGCARTALEEQGGYYHKPLAGWDRQINTKYTTESLTAYMKAEMAQMGFVAAYNAKYPPVLVSAAYSGMRANEAHEALLLAKAEAESARSWLDEATTVRDKAAEELERHLSDLFDARGENDGAREADARLRVGAAEQALNVATQEFNNAWTNWQSKSDAQRGAEAACMTADADARTAVEYIKQYYQEATLTAPSGLQNELSSVGFRSALATAERALENSRGGDKYAYFGTELIDAMQFERNKIISELLILAKAVHEAKDDHLFKKRAWNNVLWDSAKIVSTGLASVTGSESTARELSAFATGLAGIQESVDKRFFHQQTATAILSLIRVDRAEKLGPIIIGMTLDVTAYPLERALDDFVDYFLAGGLTDATRRLTADAAMKEREVNQALTRLQGLVDENVKQIREAEAAREAEKEKMVEEIRAHLQAGVEEMKTFKPGESLPDAAVPSVK